jgi:hypothetical protein
MLTVSNSRSSGLWTLHISPVYITMKEDLRLHRYDQLLTRNNHPLCPINTVHDMFASELQVLELDGAQTHQVE